MKSKTQANKTPINEEALIAEFVEAVLQRNVPVVQRTLSDFIASRIPPGPGDPA